MSKATLHTSGQATHGDKHRLEQITAGKTPALGAYDFLAIATNGLG